MGAGETARPSSTRRSAREPELYWRDLQRPQRSGHRICGRRSWGLGTTAVTGHQEIKLNSGLEMLIRTTGALREERRWAQMPRLKSISRGQ
jgi:hypothetical protein